MKTNKTLLAIAGLNATIAWLNCLTAQGGTVLNSNDSGAGSLRQVIASAANNETITFGPGVTGTIYLTSGEIPIQVSASMVGPGAANLTVAASSRVFHVFSGVAGVSISGLTISGSNQGNPGMGGGLFNESPLSLSQCVLSGCSATGSGAGASGLGGGVYSSASLAMTACTIAYCHALGASSSSGSGLGGGLYVNSSMALTNCTLTWNEATAGAANGTSLGGGIYCNNNFGASRVMVNCTVSGNQAGNVGPAYPGKDGGGIATDPLGTLRLINCIVLGNYNVCCSEDVRGRESPINGTITSLGGNLFYSGDPLASGYRVNGDGSVDYFAGSVDPVRLGALKDNGGPTPTMSIGLSHPVGSIAWDAGNDVVLSPPYSLATDQRGFPRPGAGSVHVDVGAYELKINIPCYNCSSYPSWAIGAGGRWDFPSNWIFGIPGSGASVVITNGGSKTITIDSATSSNALSISDLLVSAPSNSVNTLLLNAGPSLPLRVQGSLALLPGGALSVNNSSIQMNPNTAPTNAFANGSSVLLDGPATFYNASLDTANAFDLTIGSSALGILGMTNSTLKAYDLFVGAGANSAVTFNNTLAQINRSLFIATASGKTGTVAIVGGSFTATNNPSTNNPSLLMERGTGQLTISSGATVQFGSGLLGAFGGSATLTHQSGNLSFAGPLQLENGTLTVQEGATLSLKAGLVLAAGSNSLAQVNITGATSAGGILNCSNGPILIGPGGSGQMTISRGAVTAQTLTLGGATPGASGLLHLTGSGTLHVTGIAGCEACGFGVNDGEQDGGTLDASQTSIVIGKDHTAQYNVSGGTAIAGKMFVGYSPGFTGTFTQSGGTVTVTTSLIVGDCVSNAVGLVTLSGGVTVVTNPAHTAVLDVRNGSFTMNGGTLIVDTLIVTNPCAHFLKNGGTLIYNQLILDPNLDADGDGVPNGLEQALGMDPLNPSFVCAPAGIVAWWPGAISNANDIIGGYNGTLQSGVSFAPGKVGEAFSFDGVNAVVSIGGGPIQPPWTAEMWVNRQDSPVYSSVLLADSATALKLEQFNFTRKVGFTHFGVGDYVFNYTAPAGTWVHLAFVGNATTTQLYVNGVLQDTVAASIALPLGQLGSDSAGDRLKGLVDELSVYDRALSAAEIQAIYAAGSAGKCLPPLYITSKSKLGNNLSLSWLAQGGLVYRVQYKTNLSPGALWNDVGGDVTATGPRASKTDVLPGNAPQRFYRVEMLR